MGPVLFALFIFEVLSQFIREREREREGDRTNLSFYEELTSLTMVLILP
jgi:hypothetical protein